MKIIHYINNLGSGGAEKLLTDILPKLKNEGLDVSVLVSNTDKKVKEFEQIFESEGIKITSFNNSFYNPIQIFKLVNFINRNNFDLVHAHLFPSQYWLALASFFLKNKIRLVKTEHSVHNERKNYRILRPLEKFIYKRYDLIIAITEQVKENLEKWLNKSDNIVVINNGVNLYQIKKAQTLDVGLKLAQGVNLFMVGRFDTSQKDQSSLVKAVSLLPNNYNLFFAGEGPYIDKVKDLASELKVKNRVFFLGLRSDVYPLMKLMDLNVLSTNHEGLSGVALESLASGKPFIGSDVVGVNNIVPDKSYLFPPKNPEALANKILEVTSSISLQEVMIKKALKHVEKYDTSIMVKNYLKVYNNLFKNE
jgi:glycosyltransferase involved in cell wall biosynthesis